MGLGLRDYYRGLTNENRALQKDRYGLSVGFRA